MSNHPLLSALSLKIKQDNKIILNGNSNCTFTIETNKLYYLAGISGVGKSTLLWVLARLHPLAAGQLKFKGKPHDEIAISNWRTEIALLPQNTVILAGTVADNLLYPFQTFNIQAKRLNKGLLPSNDELQKELNYMGLKDIALNRIASSLSGGQQARLALIRVLLTKPKLILADEPTAGLDEVTAKLVFNRLQQFCMTGGAVIITSHSYRSKIHDTTITLDGSTTLQIRHD